MKLSNNVNGIVNINKPKGVTSRDVVNVLQRKLFTKAGHTGTLDPLASGVLVITLGSYTKLSEIITSEVKEYEAEAVLGIETDTLDIEGKVLKEEDAIVEKNKIIDVLNYFKTTYMQEVPKYSAVKINGKKLYEYARNNIEVKLPQKEVTIYDIKLLDYKIENNKTIIKFYTKVSKGTYIRSLIRDIAGKLNTIGIMTNLKRISQGKFNINDSYTLEDIDKGNYKILSIKEALDIDTEVVNDEEKFKIVNGVPLNKNYDKVLFLDKEGNELAIYRQKDDKLRMWKMLYRPLK